MVYTLDASLQTTKKRDRERKIIKGGGNHSPT